MGAAAYQGRLCLHLSNGYVIHVLERFLTSLCCREAWVLEPDKATRAHTFRRIALGKHCSLLLTLNPTSPREVPPELIVLGPESAARSFQNLLHDKSAAWDVSRYAYAPTHPSCRV